MMMDRHVGAPPVSKQQECKSGLVGPGTLSQPCDLMWCVKWRGESELSSAHISPDTDQGCTCSWLTDFNRCDYTRGWWRGETGFQQKWVQNCAGVSQAFQVTDCLWSSSALIHWILTEKPNICRSRSDLFWPPLEQSHCYQQTPHSLVIINPLFYCFCSDAGIFKCSKMLHFSKATCLRDTADCMNLEVHFWLLLSLLSLPSF